MGASIGWCTSGVHIGTTVFSDLYKRSNKRPFVNKKTTFVVVKNTN